MEKKVQSLYTPGWINRRLKKNWLGKGKLAQKKKVQTRMEINQRIRP